jgi:F-type H+-transporting ATPase subunit delta
MKISKQSQREARQLFRSCLAGGVLDEARVRQTVQLLLEKKPRGYVAILTRLHRLLQLDVARRTAKVESAASITPDLAEQIKTGLEKRYGAGLQLSYVVNPALLGGLRVQVGSDLYDGSVKSRLDKLAQSF